MGGLSKLDLALLLSLAALSLIGLSAKLLYVLCCRWRLRRTAVSASDPELTSVAEGRHSKDLLLYWKSQSRVEPAASPPPFAAAASRPEKPAGEAEECPLERWRAACFGPSRVLYTIREEEDREGAESDSADGGDSTEEEEEEELFSTPCLSPAFFTPVSSPPRAAESAAAGDRV